jgi:glycosyltransferase involved in cell wall biosynthesis
VSVIIPTHNEAQAIGRVLADLPSNLVTEVIVVDSNSTDGTPDLARKMGAQVIQEPRRGYGRACLTGLAKAQGPDVVVFLDGDYSDRPSELPIILGPIIEGRADITLGSRFGGKCNPGALLWHQSFGNRLAAGLIRLLYGVKVSDLGPFRAGRADVLRALALEEATYGWAVEMIVKGAIAGFRIVEVSVSYLSFAKIAYGQISLRCNAFVTVMQPAELWDLNDPSDTRDLPRKGTLLGEPQMRPRPVVISEIRSQGSPQMPGVQDHEMVQALSSYGTDQAFGIRILPGTPGRSEYLFHVQ